MSGWSELRALNSAQRNVVIACFLGWTLDAFDFFVMVLAVKAIATDFHVANTQVVLGITLTLAARPFGAFVFGWLANKYGRRPILMIDVLLFSAFELASAFAPTLGVLLVLRFLFGFAMGGEWGLGSSLVMESIPPAARGVVSGLLQEGYACGNLLAALLFWALFEHVGWRGMFVVGFVPAVLVLYIRMKVPESPVWLDMQTSMPAGKRRPLDAMKGLWGRAAFMVVLMTLFNFFSHGTQDLYPLFLQVEKGFDKGTLGLLTTIGPIGAILGGLFFGSISERIGRKKAIIIAALLVLPVLKLWAFSSEAILLGAGAFAVQFMVQGAWGVVPVHLNELSSDGMRATLPGLTYQIGNLISATVPFFLTYFAELNGKQYGLVMAIFISGVAVLLALVTWLGPEAKGKAFGRNPAVSGANPAV